MESSDGASKFVVEKIKKIGDQQRVAIWNNTYLAAAAGVEQETWPIGLFYLLSSTHSTAQSVPRAAKREEESDD